jgi:hypothetical protein
VVPSFAAPLAFDAGNQPDAVAVGDFNGDGIPDLAVVNRNDNSHGDPGSVSVLLGQGDGSFQAPVNYAVGPSPRAVAVGDFNGDGSLDLVVANFGESFGAGSSVSVLLGNGDGSFQSAQDFPTQGGSTSVAVGDFNGDGSLDLAVGNAGNLSVSVLLGNGDGTFQTANDYAQEGRPLSVTVGDFNGDGIPDLAVANSHLFGGSPGVSVLLGNGDGSFQPAGNYSVGGSPTSVAVGDFNGDGIPDLAVATSAQFGGSSGVSVLLGNGDGSFQPAQNFSAGIDPGSVAVGDFNGDGIPDLAVANYGSNTVSVLLGNGDGSFQAAQNFGTGGRPTSVAVGDFNGDGIPDLAVANEGTNDVSILLNDGAWLGGAPPGQRPLTAAPASLAEEVARLDAGSRASMPPAGATVPLVQDSGPVLAANAEQGETRAAGAPASASQPPALDPVWAQAEGAAQGLQDHLFAEPENGWLGDHSAGEPWWPRL